MSLNGDPAQKRDVVTVGTDELEFLVPSSRTEGALLACEVRMPAGGGPELLHRHDAAEIYRVEQGLLTVYVEEENGVVRRRIVRAGEVVLVPGGREHTIRNESGEEARAFVVFAPGAAMEGFARAAGSLAAPGREDVLALAAQHGVDLTRPLAEIA